ncbi:MAG: MerR family transcriptional regulator [Lachnospiraceae bacterium]|nr:MerR family transcriptional regulator [Lachnospiraceae bacterium]
MEQLCLSISDASKKVAVEPRVLRYWEDELNLTIPRNAMGHRYYREEELKKISGIKRLKEQGFLLKAIKLILPNLDKVEQLSLEARSKLCVELNEKLQEQEHTGIVVHTKVNLAEKASQKSPQRTENVENIQKMEQFQALMKKIIAEAMEQNADKISQKVSAEVKSGMIKELDYQFRMQEEQQEAHFRKIDAVLRSRQKKAKKRFWK